METFQEAISGREKTLAALSLIFAIQDYKPWKSGRANKGKVKRRKVIGVTGRGGLSRVFTLENPVDLITG